MIKQFDIYYKDGDSNDIEFMHETRYVSSLYEQLFDAKRINVKAWKINVHVLANELSRRVIDSSGVIDVEIPGDIALYRSSNEIQKAEIALAFLMKGLRRVSEEMGWDFAPFEDAKERVIAAKFVNKKLWKRPIANEAKTMTAEVMVDHRMDRAIILIIVRDLKSKELVSETPVMDDLPSEFAYAAHIGELRWKDNSTIELCSRFDPQKKFS
ncbi:MAG: hypothetical protein ING69_10150 [Rhodocyclaceae bacterium]|nr:hypothetical protein [Rhodocyclaceae bacterium]